jgi:hypothetical protein
MIDVTLAQLLDVFTRYNNAVWPLQLIAYALGVVALFAALRGEAWSGKVVLLILGFLWLWMGIVLGFLFSSQLGVPGWFVGAVLYTLQGLLLVAVALRENLAFQVRMDAYGVLGALAALYSMIGYPAIESLLGRGYPQTAPFGLVPCPTAVFTLGLLLWTAAPWRRVLLIVPLLVPVISLIAISKGIVEDLGLVALAAVVAALALFRRRHAEPTLGSAARAA